ncbi:jmjC domain-containing protein 4 [Cimex lectularius]|uniref:Jumonji domain-containing protein 4 n=1 Tax=Cimex lectularius TaxID=79782 RepID=A0A8I6TK76_CIMLE|nr:jmjC domain-containing protein 4 [Cimex lectularius]
MKILELRDSRPMDSSSESGSEDELGPINELNVKDVDYAEFYVNYLLNNRPCLIKSVSKDWPAQKKWVKHGKPDFEYIEQNYGTSEVPIVDCNRRYFNVHARTSMKLSEYLEYWVKYIEEDYPDELPCLYMKDWHFPHEFPLDVVYRVPYIFASDWINEYLINCKKDDDYRFVYFGPKGSWTPIHMDVFSSFSWSVNLCGKKKWVFFPPDQDMFLRDKFGKLPYNILEDFKDTMKYPHSSNLIPIVFIQEVGDAIFVPSGWYHQVWNLDDTISINHNWVNACNIYGMWTSLNEMFSKAQAEIADCRNMGDWDARAQLMLKLCFGMDHCDFADFLFYITEVRLQHVSKGSFLSVPGDWLMGGNQMIFDLSRIRQVFDEMCVIDIPCLEQHRPRLLEFINEIESVCDSIN